MVEQDNPRSKQPEDTDDVDDSDDLEAHIAELTEELPDEVVIFKTDKGVIVTNDKRRIFRLYGSIANEGKMYHRIAHFSKFDALPDDYDPETFDNTIKPGQAAYLEYSPGLEYMEGPAMNPSFTVQSITTMTRERFESAIKEYEEQMEQYEELVAPIDAEHESRVQRVERKYNELIEQIKKERDDAIEGLGIKREGMIRRLAKHKPKFDDFI